MSRPPRARVGNRTARIAARSPGALDYLPEEFADFVALEEALSVERAAGDPSARVAPDAGDLGRTLLELPALTAHVLAVYQDRYAGEAFIGTASAPSSLLRHARRLAYVPDPGLSAAGHVVLIVKEGLIGTVAKGLALASVPRGEQASEDYETDQDLAVDAALNRVVPADANRPAAYPEGERTIVLEGTGHGLVPGEVAALVGPDFWQGLTLESVEEGDEFTSVTVREGLAGDVEPVVGELPRLLAKPTLDLRAFGAGADAELFPTAALQQADPEVTQGGVTYRYEVVDGDYASEEIFLRHYSAEPLVDRYVLRRDGESTEVLRIDAEATRSVVFHRSETRAVATFTVNVTPDDDGGFTSETVPATVTVPITSHLSGSVKAVRLARADGTAPIRTDQPVAAHWLTGWRSAIPLRAFEPNPAVLGDHVDLVGGLELMAPGRVLVLTDRSGNLAQRVGVARAEVIEGPERTLTRVHLDDIDERPREGWALGDLEVLGNVAPVSHGRSVDQIVGGSDGVTPFQTFALDEQPVTMLPSVDGAAPALEVRVDGILWQHVNDLGQSGPDDRHVRLVIDEMQQVHLRFGDGRNGAIPPAGRRNIEAFYRVGLGVAGNIGVDRLSRIKKAHPLLERAFNRTPIDGGAEPAPPEAVRVQATRFIRTFERAVSVADHADLALLYPGVARAAARYDPARGIELVVATEEGEPPAAMRELRAFLDARRDTDVPLVLQGPLRRDVFLRVEVTPDPAHLPEQVKERVRRALLAEDGEAPGFFTFARRGLGEPVFLSALYALLEGLEGVRNVAITRFDAGDSSRVHDAILIAEHEWLGLHAHQLSVLTREELG